MKSNRGNLFCAVSALAIVMAFVTSALAAQNQQTAQKANAPAGVNYQPLNVKPGLWENTVSITRTGAMPIPPEMLSRLTPDQRARMEQRMKANAAAQSHTVTDKQCVTREDLEKPDLLNFDRRQQCTVKILESTSTTASGKMSCQSEAGKLDGALDVKAPDPEHMNSTWHATVAGNGHTMNVDAKSSSKWLASSCESAK